MWKGTGAIELVIELSHGGWRWPGRGTRGVSDSQGRAPQFPKPGLTPSDQWASSISLGIWGEDCRRRGRRRRQLSKGGVKAVDQGGGSGDGQKGHKGRASPSPLVPGPLRNTLRRTSSSGLGCWRCDLPAPGQGFRREGSWRILSIITICHL